MKTPYYFDKWGEEGIRLHEEKKIQMHKKVVFNSVRWK